MTDQTIAALIEAWKYYSEPLPRLDDPIGRIAFDTANRQAVLSALANAMPAIVAMAEEHADLRHKEGTLASELQRTREVNERLRAELAETTERCKFLCEANDALLEKSQLEKSALVDELRAELAEARRALGAAKVNTVRSHGGPWNALAQSQPKDGEPTR